MRPATFLGKCTWLIGIFGFVAGSLIAGLYFLQYETLQIEAAAIAAAVCLLAGLFSLAAVAWFHRPDQLIMGVLIGMGVRMGMPLAVAAGVLFFSAPLVNAGFLYYLLTFYLAALIVETVIALPVTEK